MIDIDDVEKRCIDIFDKEIVKFTPNDQKTVVTFCVQTCMYRKLHTLFTESELLSITENVFTDLTIRDFVLDLTDKLSVKLNLGLTSDFELEKYLASSISHFDSREKLIRDETLMPVRVLDNICVFNTDIITTMIHNKWLTTIVLINLYFFSSGFFEDQPDEVKTKQSTQLQ